MATTKPAAASGGGQQLQAYQKDMLEKLRALRECLETERAPFAKMQVERDQAVAEKEKVCCVCIRSMHPVVICSYGVFSQNALIVDATRAVSGEQREDGVPNQGKQRRERDQVHQCACAPPASTCMSLACDTG